MNNKKPLIILIAVFVLLIGGAYVLYNHLGKNIAADQLAVQQPSSSEAAVNSEAADNPANESSSEPEETTLAPDFTVYDIDGKAVKLSDFIGKPVVVNFWASWCGPCKMEMPDFNQKYIDVGEDVHFLMVNMTDGSRETVEIASKFIAEQGYSFPVFYDTESEAAITYGVTSLPSTYFIDAQGGAVAYATGMINAEILQRGIDMIMPKQ